MSATKHQPPLVSADERTRLGRRAQLLAAGSVTYNGIEAAERMLGRLLPVTRTLGPGPRHQDIALNREPFVSSRRQPSREVQGELTHRSITLATPGDKCRP